MISVRCVFARVQFLNTVPPEHSLPTTFFLSLFSNCVSLLFLQSVHDSWCICGRPLIFNALMLEGERYWHAWSFAYCVRVNNFCRATGICSSLGACLCHMKAVNWSLGWWASPISSLGLQAEVFVGSAMRVRQENFSIRICEMRGGAEPGSLVARV